MLNIHIVPHTHWDREWYFNTEESRTLLVYFMDELLNLLESEDAFKYFVLDGQAIIIEDYLEFVPENRERIKKLVIAGRLIIGPWYTQTDEMVVAGESIVRNLYYGIKKCEEFGQCMKIGYVPDSFGQSEQLPQILNGFDIHNAIFWRGMYEKNSSSSEFYWESPDGSEVFTVNLPLGYAIGKYLPHETEQARLKIKDIVDRIKDRATSTNILVPNGHDQMPVQKDLPYLITELNKIDVENNYVISSYDKYIEDVKTETKEFDRVYGELIYPKYMRVHRSIYSTRYDIKKANFEIENMLTGYIEPMLTIAWKSGFIYPHGVVEKIWKIIFQNHAHDSIGCCNTDEVHEDIQSRFRKAKEMCLGILNLNMRKISEAVKIERDGNPLVIFNTLPFERSNVFIEMIYVENKNFIIIDENNTTIPYDILKIEDVDMGTIDRRIAAADKELIYKKCSVAIKPLCVPAFGYTTYYIIKAENQNNLLKPQHENIIENSYFKIEANPNGTLNVHDKLNDKHFSEVLVIENGSDDGDEYNYSPLKDDFIVSSKGISTDIICERGNIYDKLIINMLMKVPKNLSERKQKKVSTEIPVSIIITLKSECKSIDIKINIDNKACDERFRVLFKTGIISKFSNADEQFGVIKRPNQPKELKIWEKENWHEKPVPIYPMQSFVDLTDENYGVSLISKGIREYEIIGNNYDTIALTLFRAVGILGKANLVNRPGRASGVSIVTKASQLQSKLEFEFCIYPHNGNTFIGKVAEEAKQYLVPLTSYEVTDKTVFILNKPEFTIPSKQSLMKLESDMVVSTIKKAEDKDAVLLRVFNPSCNESDGGFLTYNGICKNVFRANLKESVLSIMSNTDGKIELGQFKPCEVKTFIIE